MFTDLKRALSEFHRVLKPDGQLYVCLNGDGWYKYYIEERLGAAFFAENALYFTYFRRAIQSGLKGNRRTQINPPDAWHFGLIHKLIFRLKRNLSSAFCFNPSWQEKMNSDPSWRTLINTVIQNLGEQYVSQLYRDIYFLDNVAVRKIFNNGLAYNPDEVEKTVKEIGFSDFKWDEENQLIINTNAPETEKKYIGSYKEQLAVWEFFSRKP